MRGGGCHHHPVKHQAGLTIHISHYDLSRFHAFLLYLGYTAQAAREVRIMQFCHTLREFALEYRTCRERVLHQQQKRATYRERNKTRGRMITEVNALLVLPATPWFLFLAPNHSSSRLDRKVLRSGWGGPQ